MEKGQNAGNQSNYDPVNFRPPEQITTNSLHVFLHLFKGAFGTGVLFLPYAYKTVGYGSATLTCIFVGGVCTHTAVITVQCAQILCRRLRIPSMNFAEVAEASLNSGPLYFRKYSTAFGKATNIIVCFVQYETTIVYTLFIAESFQQIFEYFSGIDLNIRVYIVAIMPLLCMLSLIPNFAYLVPFTVVATLFIIVGISITSYYFVYDFPSPSRLQMFDNHEEVPICACVLLFSLYNMSMLMPLENSMKKPNQMSFVLAASMMMNIAFNLVFGFLGYNKYQDACDSIVKNLPLDEVPAQIVKIMVSLSILFTYGLHYYIPITILWPMIAEKIGNKRLYETFFRLVGVFLCTLLAIAIPHMAPLLSLFAAVTMGTAMMLIPIIIEISTKWSNPRNVKHTIMFIKNFIIGIIWILVMVL